MARTIAGTLNVPDTGPLANAEIFFVAKRNEATKILQGVSSVITTNGSGDYSQSIEDGYYAVSLRFDDGSGNQLHRYALGEVFVESGSEITLNALLAVNNSVADPTDAALQQLLSDAQQARDEAVAAAASIPDDVYFSGNILGTVSQSGGIPTGSVFEKVENSAGIYFKQACGKMVALAYRDVTDADFFGNGSRADPYRAGPTLALPVNFAESPTVALTARSTDTSVGGRFVLASVRNGNPTTGAVALDAVSLGGSDPAAYTWRIFCIAEGRWYI